VLKAAPLLVTVKVWLAGVEPPDTPEKVMVLVEREIVGIPGQAATVTGFPEAATLLGLGRPALFVCTQ
jgi:hypothetical protein